MITDELSGDFELWYQEHQSFMTDIKILLLTVAVIVKPGSHLAYQWFLDLPKRSF